MAHKTEDWKGFNPYGRMREKGSDVADWVYKRRKKTESEKKQFAKDVTTKGKEEDKSKGVLHKAGGKVADRLSTGRSYGVKNK